MKTTQKISRIEKSIELQKRTLRNLEEMKLSDNGSTIALTQQIIANLEASKSLLKTAH